MKHLFLTGRIQVGKSTLIQKWLSRCCVQTGGFYTKKEPERDGCIFVHILRAGINDTFRDDNILFDCRHRDEEKAVALFNVLGTQTLDNADNYQLVITGRGLSESSSESSG